MSKRVYYDGEYRDATAAEETDIDTELANVQPGGVAVHGELLFSLDTEDDAQAAVTIVSQTLPQPISGWDGYVVVLGGTKNTAATTINNFEIYTGTERFSLNYYGAFLAQYNASYPRGSIGYVCNMLGSNLWHVRGYKEDLNDNAGTEKYEFGLPTGNVTGGDIVRKTIASTEKKIYIKFSAAVQGIKLRIYGFRRI